MNDLPPGSEVARLRYPMAIRPGGLTSIVRGLEKTYGAGLVIGDSITERDGSMWMPVVTPHPHAYVRRPNSSTNRTICRRCSRPYNNPIHQVP